jgi:hypothetical protein
MTNSLNTGAKRTDKGKLTNKIKTGSLELLGLLRTTRNIVLIAIVVAVVIAGIGFANVLIIVNAYHNTVISQQCPRTPVKMFDSLNVPKYFVGPGYKIIPIDLKGTEVMVTICK